MRLQNEIIVCKYRMSFVGQLFTYEQLRARIECPLQVSSELLICEELPCKGHSILANNNLVLQSYELCRQLQEPTCEKVLQILIRT
jgi:hypothetical protein